MNESAARGSLFFKEKYARTRGAFKEPLHLRIVLDAQGNPRHVGGDFFV